MLAPSDSSSTSGASFAPPWAGGAGRAALPVEDGVGGRLTSRARSIPCAREACPLGVQRRDRLVDRGPVGGRPGQGLGGGGEHQAIPTRNFSGNCSMKPVAARWDDTRRVGSTSVAFIDPDVHHQDDGRLLLGHQGQRLGPGQADHQGGEGEQVERRGDVAAPSGLALTTLASRSRLVKRTV